MEYIPSSPPTNSSEAIWAFQELRRIGEILTRLKSRPSDIFYSAPAKPRTGMLCYADGTSWDPGSGEGLYEYRSDGNWYKV